MSFLGLGPNSPLPRRGLMAFWSILLLPLATSACRFGNNIERADTSAATDPITGYYAAEPSSVVFCAEKAGDPESATDCQEVETSKVPSDIRVTMTNPIILYLLDSSGAGLILPNDGSDYGISTQFKSLTEIESLAQSSTDTLWLDAACKRTAYLQQAGTFTKNSSTLSFEDPGSINITFTYYELFEGECETSFTQIYACMNDPLQCAEDPQNPTETNAELIQIQNAATRFLSPYLEAGVLTAEEFASLRSFAFEVVYQ